MKLTMPGDVYDAMLAAARAVAPIEACGLLGGVNGAVEQFYELENTDAAAEHYNMSPEEQFAAVKDMRAKGLRLLAIWHSHPVTPARMSEEDLRMAYTPNVVYVILSLADPDSPDIKGFTVADGKPTSVEIEIVDNLQMLTSGPLPACLAGAKSLTANAASTPGPEAVRVREKAHGAGLAPTSRCSS